MSSTLKLHKKQIPVCLQSLCVLFLITFTLASQAFGRAGDLDPAFNTNGKLIREYTIYGLLNPLTDAAVQPDGKIVFASIGQITVNGSLSDVFTVIRYNADGSIDPTFGTGGVLHLSVGFFENLVNVIIQPDGKILLSGERFYASAQTDFVLIRLNPNGTLDGTFNGTGIATGTINATTEERRGAATLLPNGKIVVVGQTDNGTSNASFDWAVFRFNANGSLDTTFDGDGKLVLPMGGDQELAYAAAGQADGKIVVTGVSSNGANNDFTTVRLNTNGALDTSFGSGGIVRTQFGSSHESARKIVIQSDNKIVVAGGANNGTNSDVALARYNTDGSLDANFGSNGLVTATFSETSNEVAFTLALQPDGKFVVATKQSYNAGLVRFNGNGSLDASFGTNGKVSTEIRYFTDAYPFSTIIQNDGKILISGSLIWLASSGPSYYFLARYDGKTNAKGTFDFEGDGKTDLAVYRPSAGEWWINRSSSAQTVAAQFGAASDKPAAADFSGDGKTDIAFWRPASGEWFILRSEDGSFYSVPFGAAGDIPAPSDFDGDGKADPAVFRPSSGEWFISKSSGGTAIVTFGAAGDVPVAADYDGDGKRDVAIFRPSDGSWWYVRSTDNQFRVSTFGVSTDLPVQGDYTGDGKADIAVFRPSSGEWFVRRSEDSSFYSVPFGAAGDVPAPGDFDGDGRFDTAIFRPADATWYVNRSTAGLMIQQFGLATDKPVQSVFLP
jgi:uncharacterized delta-60 repeat protein